MIIPYYKQGVHKHVHPSGGSMDQIKVGKFIAQIRKERGFTQESLGERLGVTNKTISRWETGKYMPDIDKLQELSTCLGVSVNELLSGEKMESADDFIKKADANLVEALSVNNAFSLQEKIHYYKRKWLKEHKSYIVMWVVVWFALLVASIVLKHPIEYVVGPLTGLIIYGYVRNKMMIYVESHAFRR